MWSGGYSSALRHDNNQTTPVRTCNPPMAMFDSLHGLSHLGTRATAKLISQRYVWPGVQKDCRTWARACQSCQRSDIQAHHHATRRLRSAYIPVPARAHRHRGPTSNVRRFQILPYGSRSLHSLAGSHSHAGHHG